MTVHKVLKKKRWITENPHFNDVEVLLKQSHLWEKLKEKYNTVLGEITCLHSSKRYLR